MKLNFFFSFLVFNLFGQPKLVVTGNARIIGRLELLNNNGNTFIDSQSWKSNSTGFGNWFLFILYEKSDTTGEVNIFLGAQAGKDNTTGKNNIFFGGDGGRGNTIGYENSFFLAQQRYVTILQVTLITFMV